MLAALIVPSHSALAEGSSTLYPAGTSRFRANLEWRNDTYGERLFRRTLLKVYANAGEYILLGSSAVDVPDAPDNGDIRVYNPGLVNGDIGNETIPATPSFSCVAQRGSTGNAAQGRIGSRAQESNGPDTIANPATGARGNAVPAGYVPCFYQAPASGVYSVAFFGPSGDGRSSETQPTGSINDVADNFDASQDTSISAWDVTVRPNLQATTSFNGRLFAYYIAMFTGGNARPIDSLIYVVADDGFQYRVDLGNMDPNGYLLYANQVGFLDSDGTTPLYRDVMAAPTLPFDQQNQLVQLQGGVQLAPPQYPIFFNPPDPAALTALNIPLAPTIGQISNLTFAGAAGGSTTVVGGGGTFRFNSTVEGVYQLVISRDGSNYDPTNPQNRVLRGVRDTNGVIEVTWDGLDNSGNPFPAGSNYQARVVMKGGEFHFPFLDVENSITGSPSFTLINPPGGICPQWNGNCSGAMFDDRGYRTANGTIVGTEVNGPLCPNNVGNPPNPLFSDQQAGYDSRSTQRAFGFPQGGNPATICDPTGGFGDKKGLDMWTFYPSNELTIPLNIVAPTAVDLVSFTASRQENGVVVRWETSAEVDTWGFHLLRSADSNRASAQRVTSDLILGQGRGQGGASYSWVDQTAQPGVTYTYWLQEIETDGVTTNEYGPATVVQGAPSAIGRVFVPLMIRGN
jgi:hypothetical protein